jgi:hypothetical protein
LRDIYNISISRITTQAGSRYGTPAGRNVNVSITGIKL